MRAWAATTIVGLAAAAGLGGCFSSSGTADCQSDRDCGDLVCTRVGACARADGIYALRVEWTVRGETTDQATACAGIAELELTIGDPTTGDSRTVRPVPCATGRFSYDKLPLSFTEVTLVAYGADGSFLDSRRASALGGGGVVRLALLP